MCVYSQAEATEDKCVCRGVGVAHLRASVFVRLKSSRVPKFQRVWLQSLLMEAPPRSLCEWRRKPSLSHTRHHAQRQQTHIWVWMCVRVCAHVWFAYGRGGFVYLGSTRLRHRHARAVFPKKEHRLTETLALTCAHNKLQTPKRSTFFRVSQNKDRLCYPLKINSVLWNTTTSGTRADSLFHTASAVY